MASISGVKEWIETAVAAEARAVYYRGVRFERKGTDSHCLPIHRHSVTADCQQYHSHTLIKRFAGSRQQALFYLLRREEATDYEDSNA